MIKSFLMIGQSNMAGRGFIHEVPRICNENIKMLRNGRWQMMSEPINYDRPFAGIGLAGAFASAWCEDNPEDVIGLVPCAEGGSAIDEWSVDGILFKHAVNEAKFAMQSSDLVGILWHQGETDSSDGNYKEYYNKLLHIMTALRKELNAFDIPILIGGLGEFLGQYGLGKSCTEYRLINQELQKFALEQNHCYFVTATGLTCNPDGIHFNAVSLRKFGLRYYEAFAERKHVLEPLLKEDERLKRIHERTLTKAEQEFMSNMDVVTGKMSYGQFKDQIKQL